MMALLNDIYDVGSLTKDELSVIVRLVSPFAPHLSEELWEMLGGKGLCSLAAWPAWDEAKTVDSTVEVAVQVNGKVRATIALPLNCPAADAIATAKANERILPFIEGKTVIKEISIPNKIINIVVK
jgi:leucyl-tRNA synthetase